MQYVSVAPDTKTSFDRQVFDYAIPAEFLANIKIGQLVLVPFHGRDILGIVVDLKKQSKVKAKLKPIKKIITGFPVFLPWQIKLAEWMSVEYFCPLGKVLFSFLPQIPAFAGMTKKGIPPLPRQSGVGRDDKKFSVIGNLEYRLKVYQRIIEKAFAKKKQVLILFPQIPSWQILNYFQKYKPAIYHAGLKNSEREKLFLEILNQNHQLIVGSQSALLLPFENLGALIIDQPNGESFKSDRQPYFVAKKVAEKISQLTGANLVLGEESLSVESFYNLKKEKQILLAEQINKKIKTVFVNLAGAKNGITETLENIINDQKKGEKILIFCERKGEGRGLFCLDCKNIDLVKNKNFPCQKCHGFNRKVFGWTTQSIFKNLSKIFPDRKILRLDKDNFFNPEKVVFDILVTTHQIFHFPFLKFDFVVVQSVDRTLSLPYFNIEERVFNDLNKLKSLAAEQFTVQTFQPDNLIFQSLNNNDQFLSRQLTDRLENKFPPFYRLITLKLRRLSSRPNGVSGGIPFPVNFTKNNDIQTFQLENKTLIKTPRTFAINKLTPFFIELSKNYKIDTESREA